MTCLSFSTLSMPTCSARMLPIKLYQLSARCHSSRHHLQLPRVKWSSSRQTWSNRSCPVSTSPRVPVKSLLIVAQASLTPEGALSLSMFSQLSNLPSYSLKCELGIVQPFCIAAQQGLAHDSCSLVSLQKYILPLQFLTTLAILHVFAHRALIY